MLLIEYIHTQCDGPSGLNRLVRERTGERLRAGYAWRWARTDRPRVLTLEHAELVCRATGGVCSMDELTRRQIIVERWPAALEAVERARSAPTPPPPAPALPPVTDLVARIDSACSELAVVKQRLLAAGQ